MSEVLAKVISMYCIVGLIVPPRTGEREALNKTGTIDGIFY